MSRGLVGCASGPNAAYIRASMSTCGVHTCGNVHMWRTCVRHTCVRVHRRTDRVAHGSAYARGCVKGMVRVRESVYKKEREREREKTGERKRGRERTGERERETVKREEKAGSKRHLGEALEFAAHHVLKLLLPHSKVRHCVHACMRACTHIYMYIQGTNRREFAFLVQVGAIFTTYILTLYY